MNTTFSAAQFFALLGGANPTARMQGQPPQGAGAGMADFAVLFAGAAKAQPKLHAFTSVPETGGLSYTDTAAGVTANDPARHLTPTLSLWSSGDVRNGSGMPQDEGKRAIVIHLTDKGLPADAAAMLADTLTRNDLITLIRDPKLAQSLQSVFASDGKTIPAQTVAALPSLASVANSLGLSIDPDAPAARPVTVADMNLEDFREWKKAHFSDLAAFLAREKTFVNQNGQIMKVLQGPSFLTEENAKDTALVMLIDPNAPVTPMEFSLRLAYDPEAVSAASLAAPAGSFAPLPLDNLGALPPALLAALEAAAGQQQAGQAGGKPGLATNGFANGSALMNGAQGAIGGQGGTANAQTAAGGSNAGSATASTSSFSALMTGEDLNALSPGGDGLLDPATGLGTLASGFKSAAQVANPLLSHHSAAQTHPTVHMLGGALVKLAKAGSGQAAPGEVQKYRLQLDPPEMGRVDIDIEFEAGQKIRATVMVEKPETLQLLQRDAHALLKSLQEAGFDTSGQDNLNFDLSQGQNDPAGRRGENGDGRQSGQNALLSPDGGEEMITTESQMAAIVDPVTGQQRINMVV